MPHILPSTPSLLTQAERDRLMALLSNVSSQTLLNVLLSMNEHNADGHLIIHALLDRIPAADAPVAVPVDPGQAPVIPR